MLMLVLAVVLVSLLLAAPASADVTGRAFTLARLPGASGAVAVDAGGSVWALDESGRLWRLAPSALRPALVAAGRSFTALAKIDDGSLMLAQSDAGLLWRRGRDGAMTIAAGVPGGAPADRQAGGDGGTATRTSLCSPEAVAGLPGGGFAFTDRGGSVVRVVGANGTISTAYAVAAGDETYDCARPASVERVTDIAAAGDARLLLALGRWDVYGRDRIVRLTGDGTATVVADDLDIRDVAAAPDGSILLTGNSGAPFPVRRLTPGARRPETVLRGDDWLGDGTAPLFDADGLPARRFFGAFFASVDVANDGAIVALAEDPGAIVYVAPRSPGRMATALAPRRGSATPRGYTAPYRVTRPGRARLEVLDRRGRVVAKGEGAARPGLNTLAVRRRLAFGIHRVRITVTGADGQRARDTVRLFLGGRLSIRQARRLAVPRQVDVGGGCSNCDVELRRVRVDSCRSLDPRQVICRYSYRSGSRRIERTAVIVSARLTPIGTLMVRRFECDAPGRCPRRPPTRSTEPELAPQQPGAPAP